MTPRVHHSAVCVQDLEASLCFYRDGLGLQVIMDHELDGGWRALFGARSDRRRARPRWPRPPPGSSPR